MAILTEILHYFPQSLHIETSKKAGNQREENYQLMVRKIINVLYSASFEKKLSYSVNEIPRCGTLMQKLPIARAAP
jgi:hypothetical protein